MARRVSIRGELRSPNLVLSYRSMLQQDANSLQEAVDKQNVEGNEFNR